MSLPPPPPSAPSPSSTTCYRHPQRETGRRCTRCGRPACGECLVQASIGSHCLECAKVARPNVATRARFWNAKQPVLVTYTLIAANVAVFIWVNAGGSGTGANSVSRREFDLGINKLLLEVTHEWYRIVSSGFLHFTLLHIAFNMLLLFQLGNLLEPAIGRIRFGLVYAASLLGGSAGVVLLQGNDNGIHGGASGAVFGLMAAAAVGLSQRGINPFSTGIGTTLLLNLLITFTIPGISIGGHIGGAVAGAACGYFALAPRQRGVAQWLTYAAPIAVAVLCVTATVSVAS